MKINKTVNLCGKMLEYTLEYKKVKNINLRVRSNGSIYISANKRVSQNSIEDFITSHADFVLNALEKFENMPKVPLVQRYSQEELREIIFDICHRVYPYYEVRGVKFPQIKFRKMTSRWGSCNFIKGILTFNTNLIYAPYECIEYVVFHEFTHFLQPNHGKMFYFELEKVCPEWKKCKKRLKEIRL